MRKLRNFLRRTWAMFRRNELDADMSEEIRLHLEERTRENIANGMSPEDAGYAALRRFGNLEQVKETVRDQRGWVWLEQLGQDIHHALRQFARAPGFTAVVTVTLALGIGATTAIYSVVDAVVLNPIPGPDPDRVVQIGQWVQYSNRPNPDYAGLSPPTLQALVENKLEVFAEIAWGENLQLDRRGEEFATVAYGLGVSENFFSLFGARPLLGRTFTAGESVPLEGRVPSQDTVIVLTYKWWKTEFGGDANVLGRTTELGGRRFTIVGVMPEYFTFPGTTQFWLPANPKRPQGRTMSAPNTTLIARLKDGVTPSQAQAVLDALAQRLLRDYPAGDRYYGDLWRRTETGLGLWCRPLHDVMQGGLYAHGYEDLRRTLFSFLAAIGFVLAIVCANVASLTLARVERRQQEFAVRGALGASRGRLMRQLLTENLLISLLGGLAGLFVTHWTMKVLMALNTMPRLRPIVLDERVLGIALLVSLVTGLVFGLAPAWQAGRGRVTEALSQGGVSLTAGLRGRRLRSTLVVLEVALAVVLLAGAGLMIQSVVRLLRVDPGFDPVNLVDVSPDLTGQPGVALNSPEKRNLFLAQLHERLAALPGVSAVGIFKDNFWEERFLPEGRPEPVMLNGAHSGVGESDYFRAARIALVAGRFFDPGDIGPTVGTVIVNETMAELCWPGERAIGKTFSAPNRRGAPTYEVVGVVRDARLYRFDEIVRPMFYRPYHEASLTGARETFVVRTQNVPATLIPAMRAEIRALKPDLRMPYFSVYQQQLFDATRPQRTYRNYLMVFAGTGLLLAALGIYAVLAYSVTRRTREIGIRMALGADRHRVMRLVMGEGGRLIVAGVVLGVLATYWLMQFLRKQLFAVSPHDPVVLSLAVMILGAVALLACWLPARRAAGVNPMTALRAE